VGRIPALDYCRTLYVLPFALRPLKLAIESKSVSLLDEKS